MHVDPQMLENSFEPVQNGAKPSMEGKARDPAVEDFTAFFEKLSAIDDLHWSSTVERSPAGKQTGSPTHSTGAGQRKAMRAKGARQVAASGARPKMTILKSDAASSHDSAGPHSARPPENAADEFKAAVSGRITPKDVSQFLKMTLAGLVLFGLGLGAGWAALLPPGGIEQAMPGLTRLMERAQAGSLERFRDASATGGAGVSKADAAPGQPSAVVTDAVMTDAGATSPAHASRHKAQMAARQKAQSGQNPAETKAPEGPRSPAGTARKAAPVSDIELPVVRTASATTSATAAPASAATPATVEQGRYTLQVGACSSYACVQSYRKLLLAAVGSRSIKVVKQSDRQRDTVIQRIRIEPLGKAEAEQLKSALISIDPRFNDAYLIALP